MQVDDVDRASDGVVVLNHDGTGKLLVDCDVIH